MSPQPPAELITLGLSGDRPYRAPLTTRSRLFLLLGSLGLLVPALLVLLTQLGEQASWVMALCAALPGGAILLLIVAGVQLERSMRTMLKLQQLAVDDILPALAMSGIIASAGEAIAYLTQGFSTLDPDLNIYHASRMHRVLSPTGELCARLDTPISLITTITEKRTP